MLLFQRVEQLQFVRPDDWMFVRRLSPVSIVTGILVQLLPTTIQLVYQYLPVHVFQRSRLFSAHFLN